jgi:putative phage-type endonuclease
MESVWNKTTGITAFRVFDTESATEKQWLDFRRTGIGGSDIGAIAGINKYASALDIYAQKVSDYSVEETESMHWGKCLEDSIATEYQKRHQDSDVRRVKAVLRHQTDSIAIVNLDRIIMRAGMPTGVLEIKTASEYSAKNWIDGQVPDQYMAQVQWQLYVTGLTWGVVAVLIGGRRYMEIDVERNDAIISALVSVAHQFWNMHVLSGIAPNPSQSSDEKILSDIYEKSNGLIISLPDSAQSLISDFQRASDQVAYWDEQKDLAGAKLKALLGDNEQGIVGDSIVSWKSTKDSESFDAKAFKAANPDLARSFTFKKPGSRRFTVKQISNDMKVAA